MLNVLRQIVVKFTAHSHFADAVKSLVCDVTEAMNADVCSIYLLNAEHNAYALAATDGLNQSQVGSELLELDQGLVGLVGRRAEPLNLEQAQQHPKYYFLPDTGEEAFNSFLGVPIIHQRRVLGVLVVQQKDSRKFDESEEAFLVTLAAQLATVVSHAEAVGDSALPNPKKHKLEDSCFIGVPGAPGIAIGAAVVIHPVANLEAVPEREAENIVIDLVLLERSLEAVRTYI